MYFRSFQWRAYFSVSLLFVSLAILALLAEELKSNDKENAWSHGWHALRGIHLSEVKWKMETWCKVVVTHMARTEPEIIGPWVSGGVDLLCWFLRDGLKLWSPAAWWNTWLLPYLSNLHREAAGPNCNFKSDSVVGSPLCSVLFNLYFQRKITAPCSFSIHHTCVAKVEFQRSVFFLFFLPKFNVVE